MNAKRNRKNMVFSILTFFSLLQREKMSFFVSISFNESIYIMKYCLSGDNLGKEKNDDALHAIFPCFGGVP